MPEGITKGVLGCVGVVWQPEGSINTGEKKAPYSLLTYCFLM